MRIMRFFLVLVECDLCCEYANSKISDTRCNLSRCKDRNVNLARRIDRGLSRNVIFLHAPLKWCVWKCGRVNYKRSSSQLPVGFIERSSAIAFSWTRVRKAMQSACRFSPVHRHYRANIISSRPASPDERNSQRNRSVLSADDWERRWWLSHGVSSRVARRISTTVLRQAREFRGFIRAINRKDSPWGFMTFPAS